MSVGSSPPQTPPQVSPDGRWVWDGSQWQPVPLIVGDIAGVAPVVAVAPAPAPAAAVIEYPPPRIQAQVQVPVIPYAVPMAEETSVPLWEKDRPQKNGVSIYLFAGAAVVVLIMAMMALNSLNIVRMPWQSDGQVFPTPAVSPTPPLTVRSDAARADRFVGKMLTPAIDAVSQTVPSLQGTCGGNGLTVSCQESLMATEQQMSKLLAVTERANVPSCIADPVSKLRVDFAAMEGGLTLALTAWKENKPQLLATGQSRFFTQGGLIPGDLTTLGQAQKTCDAQQVGP